MSACFAHLKVHSEYSLLDSIVKIDELLDKCYARGIPAVAITDICNMFATVKFYEKSIKKGIKPIFGCDLYISTKTKKKYEITLLAKSNKGYKNISQLISRGYLERQRHKDIPVIPKEWLETFELSDVICLSSGLQGEIADAILTLSENEVEKLIKKYVSIFGKSNFFIEIQKIGLINEDKYIRKAILIAKNMQIPIVATNPIRFLSKQDYENHEIRLAIYEGRTLHHNTEKSKYTEQQYIRSAQEMHELFSEYPESLSNSIAIAKKCNVIFKLGGLVLPHFTIPDNMNEVKYFQQLSREGLRSRIDILKKRNKKYNVKMRDEYIKRLDHEVEIICKMNFTTYFLVVHDFVNWGRNNNIPIGPGRGSGAGSLVAYSLKITDIDPIQHGLLFERFLNPERVSMPDFDIDFCINGRDKIIEYITEKYGYKNVAGIVTYSSMTAKAVVRDVGRVMGFPYGFVDKIAKLIPNDLGITLNNCYVENTPLHEYAKNNNEVKTILKKAQKLEGLKRGIGRHAAGVVISPSQIYDFLPTYCEEHSTQLITQFDKKDIEKLGLIKFDILGLRNLTIIDETVKIINNISDKNNDFKINDIPLNDEKTFLLLQKGSTTGIFQFESYGMKGLTKKIVPQCFQDIIALVALYRPGPLESGMVDDFIKCKHGRQEINYPHPKLKKVLEETYGIILYQEQIIEIVKVLANYSLGNADLLRQAIGKKNLKEVQKQEIIFTKQAHLNGISVKLAETIFALIEKFARYGFNKSHSTAYAVISYQTAYLKAHYLSAFSAALMSADINNTDKISNIIAEHKKLDLKMLLPNVNLSQDNFTVNKNDEVLYGLEAIKGIGDTIAKDIFDERQKYGKFKTIYDFCARMYGKVNKRICETLIFSGAMDGFNITRIEIAGHLKQAMARAEQLETIKITGQKNLFDFDQLYGIKKHSSEQSKLGINLSKRQELIKERSLLGAYLSNHIVNEDKFWTNILNIIPIKDMSSINLNNTQIMLLGIIVMVKQRKTKKGKTIWILTIEDTTDRTELLLFDEIYGSIKSQVNVNTTVVVIGKTRRRNDENRFLASEIHDLNTYVDNNFDGFALTIGINSLGKFITILKNNCNNEKHQKLIKIIKLQVQNNEKTISFVRNNLQCSLYKLFFELQTERNMFKKIRPFRKKLI